MLLNCDFFMGVSLCVVAIRILAWWYHTNADAIVVCCFPIIPLMVDKFGIWLFCSNFFCFLYLLYCVVGSPKCLGNLCF